MFGPAPRAQLLQLLVSAQNDELRELEPLTSEFAPELIQRSLDRRCFGDRVATAIRRHDRSVTLVRHHAG